MAAPDSIRLLKQDDIQYQKYMIETLQDTFERNLVPDDVMDNMNLPESVREEIHEKASRSREKGARKLIKTVLHNPDEYISLFIAALRSIGFRRFTNILDDQEQNRHEEQQSEKYELLLRLMEGSLKEILIPSEFLPYLEELDILGLGDDDVIMAIERSQGPIQASHHLFLCMKRKDPLWPLKFLEALYRWRPELVRKVDRNIQANGDDMDDDDDDMDDDDNDDGDGDESIPGTSGGEGMMSNDTEEQTHVKEIAEADSPTSQGEGHKKVADFSDEEKQEHEGAEKLTTSVRPTLRLREYQKELSENALRGRNTIICAPTGSGKTRVALNIVQRHLEAKDGKDKTPRKVVFLARTVPLVVQQNERFHDFLQDYRIFKLTGEDECSLNLDKFLDMYDIIVMTPQILVNQIKDKKIKTLSVFSLIVFDECHHTRKGEPYNNLMLNYLIEKSKDRNAKLPQIVGLTASLGVEKATVDEDAVENILHLCANLDAPYLSTVEKNLAELHSIVPVPDEKTVSLTENHQDPARKAIEKNMSNIELLLYEVNNLGVESIDKLIVKRPSSRDRQPYGQWAVQLKNEAKLVTDQGVYQTGNLERANMARSIFVMADQLFKYNAALEIHYMVRMKDVLDYLQTVFRHRCSPDSGDVHVEVEKKLDEYFRDLKKKLITFESDRRDNPERNNPNLTVLAKKLKELLDSKGDNSRVIIFVRTRATCTALTNWLNEDEHIDAKLRELKAMPFTGAGAHEDEGGMTQVEQDKVISKFRKGDVKLIVATSVAEEGLDIPECNIVIKYNHVGNEITTLQTRGRSRKAGGTSVLFGNTKIRQKEMMNVARAAMMQRAITVIKNRPHDAVCRSIYTFQQKTVDEQIIKERIARHQKQAKINEEFKLICTCCKAFCADGQSLRIINGNQHVSVDKDFISRIDLHPFKGKKKEFDGIQMMGSMQCKKCHHAWGVMIIYRGVRFPSLGIKHFTVVNSRTGEPIFCSKWMNMPYSIQEIDTSDLTAMLGGNPDASDEDEDEFDLC